MEITIKANPKEIATLVLALQEQRSSQYANIADSKKLNDYLSSSISNTLFKIP